MRNNEMEVKRSSGVCMVFIRAWDLKFYRKIEFQIKSKIYETNN